MPAPPRHSQHATFRAPTLLIGPFKLPEFYR